MERNPHLISVVIRTKNSAATLGDVVAGLGLEGGDDLIVVDSGSTDATLDIARRAGARIVDVSHEPFSYGKSLNAGFSVAQNDWVLSLSSHCIPVDSRLLDRYRGILSEAAPEIGCIAGGAVEHRRQIKTQAIPETCTPVDFQRGVYFTCINPNSLYRKSTWQRHHFDEQIETAEDLEWSLWALRNGYSLMRYAAACVFYRSQLGWLGMVKKGYMEGRVGKRLVNSPPLTVGYLLREMFWNGANVLRGRTSLGFATRRICYLAGAFWACRPD